MVMDPGRAGARVLYIANVRIPSERTNSIQVAKMCSAFVESGADITLVIPFRPRDALRTVLQRINIGRRDALTIHHDPKCQALSSRKRADIDSWYALSRPFRLWMLPYLTWGRRRRMRSFAHAASKLAAWLKPDLVYTRSLQAARDLSACGQPVVLESHDLAWDRKQACFQEFLNHSIHLEAFRGLVTISKGLADAYEKAGAASQKLHVLHDGVDLERFSPEMSRAEARSLLGFSPEPDIICHSGNMGEGRGIGFLIEAVSRLEDVRLVLVGGRAGQIQHFQALAESMGVADRVVFAGYVSNRLVPLYLWAADVLVMAATTSNPIAPYTSPLKMFEYMAARRAIVATGFETIREVLRDGHNALLVEPDNVPALARAIRQLLSQPELARRIASQARQDAIPYTWQRRAATILDRFL